ncbi:phosphotransferase [Fredinandcohnia humi]
MLHYFVLPDGRLDEQKVLKIEHVYQGMNGRFVERFFINPDQSYIFKPLTHDNQIGRELWVHNHILKQFPSFYPKVLSYSIDPDVHWIIFEDVGVIDHIFSAESVLQVTKLMADWHKTHFDTGKSFPQKGHKPFFEEVVELLETRRKDVESLAVRLHIPVWTIESLFQKLKNVSFTQKKVLSHGDLHLGNYGYANGKLFIIDWEHAHLNSPYWDLYHLLDISHPVFPKRISKKLRNSALELYLDVTGYLSTAANRSLFKHGYYLFSSTFSLWMLLLIEADIERNETKWSRDQLKLQLEETVVNFTQCIEELHG